MTFNINKFLNNSIFFYIIGVIFSVLIKYPAKVLYEDYDYSYTLAECVPQGWTKLFLQMCEDIRQPLIDADYLDKFRFSQVKEKYGSLCCYNFGCPKTVERILTKYEHISRYVCNVCGRPATYETSGYILPWCTDCWKDRARHEKGEFIEWNPTLTIERFTKESGMQEEVIDCSDEWYRLFNPLR